MLRNTTLAAWLHDILHLEEGDLEDAENWYNRAHRQFRSRGTLDEALALFEAEMARPHPVEDGTTGRALRT